MTDDSLLAALKHSMRQEARGFQAVRMSISHRFKRDYDAHVVAAQAAAEAGHAKRERWHHAWAQVVARQLEVVLSSPPRSD